MEIKKVAWNKDLQLTTDACYSLYRQLSAQEEITQESWNIIDNLLTQIYRLGQMHGALENSKMHRLLNGVEVRTRK